MTGIVLVNKYSDTFTGKIDDLTIGQSTKTSVVPIAGADVDVVQKMGASNKTFAVKGYVTVYDAAGTSGDSSVEFLNKGLNFTGSIYWYSGTLKQTLIPTTVVFFQDLQWSDKGSRPLEREFTLSLVELK
jgi:hypothetical protein